MPTALQLLLFAAGPWLWLEAVIHDQEGQRVKAAHAASWVHRTFLLGTSTGVGREAADDVVEVEVVALPATGIRLDVRLAFEGCWSFGVRSYADRMSLAVRTVRVRLGLRTSW